MSHIAKQAVDEYFDVLLTKPEPEPRLKAVQETKAPVAEVAESPPEHQVKVAKLLAQAQQQALVDTEVVPEPEPPKAAPKPVHQVKAEAVVKPVSKPVKAAPVVPIQQQANEAAVEEQPKTMAGAGPVAWLDELGQEFQCLYFKVAGLVLAVPLQLLGGIKQVNELSKLPGQPGWLLGQQIEREQAIYAVDSCRWLMPDRYQQLADNIDYQYLVQLGSSRYAFACEELIDAEPLTKQEVKWRQQGDKRRYLAGIVKEKMCVVLDVPELIGLLDAGLDSKR